MAEIKRAITHELIRALINNVLNKIRKLSIISYKSELTVWNKIVRFFYNIFGKEYVRKIKVKNVKDLIRLMMYESNKIQRDTRRGDGTFVICNTTTAAKLMEDSQYFISPQDVGTTQSFGQPYAVGRIANLIVYVDPFMSYKDNTIYVGRKSSSKEEPGIHVPFLNNSYEVKVVDQAPGLPKILVRMRYAVVEVGNSVHNNYRKFTYKGIK